MQGYDSANRPIRLWARDGADQKITLRQRLTYGDSSESGLTPKDAKDRNLIGKGYQHYDEAGVQAYQAI